MDLSRHRPIYGIFPAECQCLRQTFQRFRLHYLRNIFTAFAVGLSGKKLHSQNARKFFIIAVYFLVLSTWKGYKKHSWTRNQEKIFIYARPCISWFILLHEKFLQFDWLRAVVFQLNLKHPHVKITKPLRVVV